MSPHSSLKSPEGGSLKEYALPTGKLQRNKGGKEDIQRETFTQVLSAPIGHGSDTEKSCQEKSTVIEN